MTDNPGVNQKRPILVVCVSLPPVMNGAATVVDNLSRAFARGEMVLAGERTGEAEGHRRDPALPPLEYVTRQRRLRGRGKRWFAAIRWLSLPRAVRRLETIVEKYGCGAIVAVFPDAFYLRAAYLASRRTGVPLYPYFHNTYSDNRRGVAQRFARLIESRVFAAAARVFVMSEGLRDFYQRQHPQMRFVPLVHSFIGTVPPYEPPPPSKNPAEVGFLGTINQSNLEALRRFAGVVESADDYRLVVYSGQTPQWALEKLGLAGNRMSVGRAEYRQEREALARHDVLFLPHGLTGGLSQVEYDTIFPTRTIPYLLARRPILAHSPEGSFLTRWLREHDCAEIVTEPDERQLREALARLREDEDRRRQLVRNALAAAAQFQASAVAQTLRRTLAEAEGAAMYESRGR